MPEYTQSSFTQFSFRIGLDRLIHTEILMIPCENLSRLSVGMIIKDEVFIQIKEVLFLADTAQHGGKSHAALIILGQAFPLVEEFILTAQRTDLGLHTVGEHEERIIVEQERDRVLIIGVVLRICVLDIYIIPLQLDEKEWQAVDKTNDISAPPIQITMNLHLLHGKEVVVVRIVEIDDQSLFLCGLPARLFYLDWNSIADQVILLFIDLQE